MREERKQTTHRIADLIAEVMKSTARPRRRELGEVSQAWARAAGPEVARRSRPVRLRAGRLTVSFESAAVRQEVASFRREEILAKLRAEYPGGRIASLKCVLG